MTGHDYINDASIEIPEYQLFRQNRGQNKPGGGLCIYAKSSLKPSVMGDTSLVSDNGFQQLWLRVQCRNYKSFLVWNVYCPPNTLTSYFESLASSFVASLQLNYEIIVLGDLNCTFMCSCPDATYCSTLSLPSI